MKESFLLYASQYQATKHLSLEDKGRLFDAIFQYNGEGIEPSSDSPIYTAFMFIKYQLDVDNEKYQLTVKKNQENGAKGGRPRNPEKPKKPTGLSGLSEKPKKPDNDTENGNGTENDLVNTNLKQIVDFYNEVFKKDITSYSGFEANFNHWLKTHSIDKMKRAILAARKDKFWGDKLTLTILFRKKNTQGEAVDNIEDFSSKAPQKPTERPRDIELKAETQASSSYHDFRFEFYNQKFGEGRWTSIKPFGSQSGDKHVITENDITEFHAAFITKYPDHAGWLQKEER